MPTQGNVCSICRKPGVSTIFTAKDRNRRVNQCEFTIMRCASCGVGMTVPGLSSEELRNYYPREYFSIDNNLALELATRPHNQRRVDRIRRFQPSGRLLDVGAGTGMFLRTANESGFEVEGLEIASEAAAFGRATWGLNIRQEDLLGAQLPHGQYDVVTLGHVFEHLHNPHGAAQRVHNILRPGGLMVVSVPNFESFQARLFRSHWFHLDVPRHLFHYTPSAMKLILTGTGFDVVEITFFSGEHNWAGITGSIMELSRPGESSLHKIVRKLIGIPIGKCLGYLEALAGRGGTFELYAVKR